MIQKKTQKFNSPKFQSISFTHKKNQQNLYFDDQGNPIQSKDHIKDLGITMSHDASFNTHIGIITSKAHQLSGWAL